MVVFFLTGWAHCGAQDSPGGIRGVVYDAEFEGPVAEATVRILELNREAATAADGHFLFGDVPAGSYTLSIVKPGYERTMQSPVAVAPGSLADLTVLLKGEFTEMDELVVRDVDLSEAGSEIGLLNLRGSALTFQDSVGKDRISRAGASDVASALRLVVGTSVADGKYATVRGLSDRYVGVALNGLRVPSADPRKRAVQLDMFPSGTIESLSVSKTFTPELPGDYSGGGIDIRTIGIPDEPFLRASIGREFNRSQTGKPGYVTYEGGGINRWGRQLGARDIPPEALTMERENLTSDAVRSFHDTLADDDHPHSSTNAAYDRITRSLAPAMGVRRTRTPSNHSYGLSGGTRTDYGGGVVLGATAALAYSSKYASRLAAETEIVVPPTNNVSNFETTDFLRESGTAEVKWSLLGATGLELGEHHAVSLLFLRNRAASDTASVRIEEHEPTSQYWEQQQAIHYVERSIDIMQLSGRHSWGDWLEDGIGASLGWFGTHNIAEQYEPDVRNFRNAVVQNPVNTNFYIFQQQAPGASGAASDRTLRL